MKTRRHTHTHTLHRLFTTFVRLFVKFYWFLNNYYGFVHARVHDERIFTRYTFLPNRSNTIPTPIPVDNAKYFLKKMKDINARTNVINRIILNQPRSDITNRVIVIRE